MSAPEFTVILALIAISAITVSVIWANPRRPPNVAFALMGITIALWIAANARTFQARTPDEARWGIVTASAAAGWVALAAHALRIAIREHAFQRPLPSRPFFFLSVTAVAVVVLCSHPLFLQRVEFSGVPVLAEPRYGPLFHVYGLYLFVAMIMFVILVRKDRGLLKGIARVEMEYLLLGTTIAMVMGTTFGIGAVIVLRSSRFVPLANAVTVLTLSSIVAYGLAVRRIVRVERAVRTFSARLMAIVMLGAIYALTLTAWVNVLRFFDVGGGNIAHWMAAIAVGMTGRRVMELAERAMVHWWPIDSDRELARLEGVVSRRLMSVQSAASLLADFPATLAKTLDARHARVCAAVGDRIKTIASFPPELPDFEIGRDHPAVKLLLKEGSALPRYAIERRRYGGVHWHEVLVFFESAGAEIAAIATGARNDLYMVTLGARNDGRIYDAGHIVLLGHLCDEFAFAVENARLYTEVDDARRYNETLLHHVADGVIACDADGRITALNREAGRLLHAGPRAAPATLEDVPPTLRDILRRTLEGQPPAEEIELSLDHDREPCLVRVRATALLRSDGTRIGAIATLRDVTAQRRFEERARRADRLASVGTLAASMAHEIKNPLVTIKTFIQLLPRAFDDPDLRTSICPLIATEVERIDSVVNRLLDFARPMQPTLAPIRLHEVLSRTLRLIDPRRRARNIEIRTDLQAPNDRILGDRSLLEQVFVNLCFNAIEAMPEGGTLTLSSAIVQVDTGQRDLWGQRICVPRLRISVSDTGHGIPPDVLPRVFDPFVTTKPDGSGLGLTIAHGILHEHHAMMDIQSHPGAGTVVHVLFQLLEKTSAQDEATA